MSDSIFDFLSELFGGGNGHDSSSVSDEDSLIRLSPAPNRPASNVFGLVIGINKYHRPAIGHLRGAVPDAKAMVKYLCDHLQVPATQIATLFDYNANRKNVIQAFKDLETDPRIGMQDPIIIFYAGRGGELACPLGWPISDQKVRTLVPSDEGSEDYLGRRIESIPDRTLAVLLSRIMQAKGNNITVIFDTSYSSSGAREFIDHTLVRHVDSNILTSLRSDTDQDILSSGTRAVGTAKDQRRIEVESPVFLTACGVAEASQEMNGRGVFTKALLDVLYTVGADTVTYGSLMDRLRALPNQTPRCEEENKSRVIFGSKVTSKSRRFVQVSKMRTFYALPAGLAQGITVGATFDVHRKSILNSSTNPPLGSFVAKLVGPLQSILEPTGSKPHHFSGRLYARQKLEGRSHKLLVFFTEPFVRKMHSDRTGWEAGLGMHDGAPEFGYARTESEAGLVIGLENGRAVFDTRNELVTANGLTRIPHDTSPTARTVVSIIRAAAKWNWHVNRTNPNDSFDGKVWIEMTRLMRRDDGSWTPVGDNLNNSSTGVVDLVESSNCAYGFKLINESCHDLYPYLFYFDANDQSIRQYYPISYSGTTSSVPQLLGTGPSGRRLRGELTLGYSTSSAPVLTTHLPNVETHGVVVLKLFIATKPVDFDLLAQNSPFKEFGLKPDMAPGYQILGQDDQWGTSMMVVVRRKMPKPTQVPIYTSQALQEHLIGRSQAPVLIRSSGLVQTKRSWFQTPPVSANRLAVINNMRLRTHARDQELYGGVKGASHSWFDVVVLDTKGNIKSSKSNRDPCVWKSHANKINSRDYVWIDGLVFDEHHEIWVNLEPGDSIQVVLNAQMNDYVNDAAEGHLMFW